MPPLPGRNTIAARRVSGIGNGLRKRLDERSGRRPRQPDPFRGLECLGIGANAPIEVDVCRIRSPGRERRRVRDHVLDDETRERRILRDLQPVAARICGRAPAERRGLGEDGAVRRRQPDGRQRLLLEVRRCARQGPAGGDALSRSPRWTAGRPRSTHSSRPNRFWARSRPAVHRPGSLRMRSRRGS